MKRLLALMLAMLMLLAVFTGCSTDSGEQSSSQSQPEASASSTASSNEPEAEPETNESAKISYPLDNPGGTTIKLWLEVPPMIGPYADDMSQVAAFRAATEATGVQIEVTSVSTAASEAFNLMISSGSYADFDLLAGVTQMYGSASAAFEDGIIMDLSGYVDEFMPDFAAFIEEYDFAKYISTDNGELLDIAGLGAGGRAMGTSVRMDWLDALKMDIPVTYDDYYNVLTAFKTEYDCPEPFLMNSTGFVDADFLCGGYGISQGGYIVDGGTVNYTYTSDGYKQYVTMLNKWYNEGLFSEDFLSNVTGAGFSYDAQMLGGQTGLFVTGADALGASYAESADDPNFHVVAIADAVVNEGDIIKVGVTPNRDPVSNRWNVTTGCDDIELVLKYCNWFFTEAGGIACNWGIENEGFTYVNGLAEYTDLVINNPDGLALFVSTALYTNWSTPYILDIRTEQASYDSDDQRQSKDVWNSNRTTENRYVGDLSALESEQYSAIYGDIETYAAESTVKFITGVMSVENDWDDYIAAIESMNIKECIKLKQDAYDRYILR